MLFVAMGATQEMQPNREHVQKQKHESGEHIEEVVQAGLERTPAKKVDEEEQSRRKEEQQLQEAPRIEEEHKENEEVAMQKEERIVQPARVPRETAGVLIDLAVDESEFLAAERSLRGS